MAQVMEARTNMPEEVEDEEVEEEEEVEDEEEEYEEEEEPEVASKVGTN